MTTNVPLTTVARAFEIIELIRERGGASISELTEELELPKSTVHDSVTTLAQLGYLRNDDGTYDLSLKFLAHGRYAQNNIALTDIIQPYLDDLAEQTEETVWYIVEEHGKAVYVGKAAGGDALQPYASIGTRSALHSIAGGKAILAFLPDERVNQIVEEHGLERHTEQTITTREELEATRERIRERGYAFNWGETIDGWRAVASPIVISDDCYGAIAVAGPKNRLRGEWFEETLPKMTADTTNELQLQLRSSPTN